MRNLYWISPSNARYELYSRTTYRFYRELLRNPFRYLKMQNFEINGLPHIREVSELAKDIIKHDDVNIMVIFPTSQITRHRWEKLYPSFVVVTKESIKVIRKNYDRTYFESLGIKVQKQYIELLLQEHYRNL